MLYAAPALKTAEAKLQDAEKLARDKMHAENTCGASSKTLFDDVAAVKEEIEARRIALENARNRIDELNMLHPKRLERIEELKKMRLKEEEDGRQADAKLASLRKTAGEWEAKVPPEEEKIKQLREEGEALKEKLTKVRDSLHRWREEKEQAVSLHAKAQDLLNPHVTTEFKPGKRADSPQAKRTE